MNCRICWFLVFVVVCTWNLRVSSSQDKSKPSAAAGDTSLLSKILNSIFMGLRSMEKNIKNLNLDSILGMKIVRDQLKTVRNKLKKSSLKCVQRVEFIDQLINKSDKIIQDSTPHVIKLDPSYYEKIGATIKADWSFDVPSRSVDVTLLESPAIFRYNFNENDSDECLGNLVNTPRCQISDECWSNTTAVGRTFYPLTHQLLYLQVGVIFGCFPYKLVMPLESRICSNIFSEYLQIKSLNFPQNYRDLFMEQAALCGMSGFHEFFDKESLESIFSWQDAVRGCWKFEDKSKKKVALRMKRSEKLLGDNCLCHRTVVALAALSQFVKYKMEGCH